MEKMNLKQSRLKELLDSKYARVYIAIIQTAVVILLVVAMETTYDTTVAVFNVAPALKYNFVLPGIFCCGGKTQ